MNDIGQSEIVTHIRVVALFRDKLVHRPLSLFDSVSPAPDSSEHLALRSEHSESGSEHLESEQEDRLSELASAVQGQGRVPKTLMEATILALCGESWLTLRKLAKLLNRDPDSLRNHYINPMLRAGRLQARVPGKPNHPNQAYRRKD